MFYASLRLALSALGMLFDALQQSPGMDKVSGDGIEHTVDVAGAAWGRVQLGQFHIFVDAHADGDAGKVIISAMALCMMMTSI